MSDETLPANWVTCTLADIGKVVSGGTPSTEVPEYWGNDVRWISPSDLTGYKSKFISRGAKSLSARGLDNCSAKLMPAGSVHFSSRAPIGYVVISVESLCTNQGFKSLVLGDGIFNEFVYFYLKSIKALANSLATGTTFKELSGSAFAKLPFPLPPLAEQKRIVAKIEELFSELEAGEESLRVARRQLGVYRQSLLKQAFEGKLTAQWRTQNPAKLESPATLPEAEGPHVLPAGWRWIKLGTAIDEPAYGTSKKCSYESSGLGVLRIPNIVNGAIEADDLKFAKFTDDERKSYELRSGDLLLIRSNGSVSIVGRCAIVEPKHTGLLYAGYLIRLRPRNTLLDSRFLLSQFASHRLRSQIEFSAKSTSGVNNINSKEIQRLVIALPSLPEQQEIVRLLDAQFEVVERNEREIDAALKRSEALRQAILKKAFTGRLVSQDPADEPASELLARIRAEHSAPSVPSKVARARAERESTYRT